RRAVRHRCREAARRWRLSRARRGRPPFSRSLGSKARPTPTPTHPPAGVGMTPENSPVSHPALDAEYEIIRELGRGGTALVYLARERGTGDEVAIKVIRSRYIDDEEAQARFAREARLVAQLHHPNIVPVRAVLDLGTAGLAIVMSHVVGHKLKEMIRQDGPLHAIDAERHIHIS